VQAAGRSSSSSARRERARRRRRRLLPLVLGLVLLVGLVAYLGARSSSTSSGPQTTAPAVVATTTAPFLPPPITTHAPGAAPGDGQWTSKTPWAPGPPSVLEATWHPFADNSSIVAYAFWMRAGSTLLALFPGYKGPGITSADRGPEQVPTAGRRGLLATFNSGFYIDSGDPSIDSPAGFYTNDTLYYPMRQGLATVVQRTDGTVDVVNWTGGSSPGPDVLMARQNLPLLVDQGAPTPISSNNSAFGVTLGNVSATWRTGLGVDARGDLVYVAASGLTSAGLAQLLVQAGARRGMELDINPAWPVYNTYTGPDAAGPILNIPNSEQVPTKFLTASIKDFFALYLRNPGVLTQPW
jgi:Phosphodiester glycosidase